MKRVKKLQEFSAHGSSVNCAKVSRRSGDLLVTGGDDRKVNVWAIGHNKARASLSGHQGAVGAVAFDLSEEAVAAGSAGGSVKLWDIEQERVNRSFSGHRTHIRTVEFHPAQGEVVASGAADTHVRVWDIRNKACLHTYKGHVKGISSIAFSPDGNWIATGSEDGEVKLWDLRTCELLHSFKDHLGKITGMQYHPRELMLATASADRTVRLWDLDHFEEIENIGPAMAEYRSIEFSPEGDALLTVLPHGLQVVGWEPACVHDLVEIPWKHVTDLGVSTLHDRVIGCACKQTKVQVWSVGLKHIQPFAGYHPITPQKRHARPQSEADGAPSRLLGQQHTPVKLTPSSSDQSLHKYSEQDSDVDSMKGLRDVPANNAARQSQSPSPVNPPSQAKVASPRFKTGARPRSSSVGARKGRSGLRRENSFSSIGQDPDESRQSYDSDSTGDMRHRGTAVVGYPNPPRGRVKQKKRPHGRSSSAQRTSSDYEDDRSDVDELPRRCGSAELWRPRPRAARSSIRSDAWHTSADFPSVGGGPALTPIPERRKNAKASQSSRQEGRQPVGGRQGNASFKTFVPKRMAQGVEASTPAAKLDTEFLSEMMAKRQTMQQILATRQSNLQLLRSFWTRGDVRGALRAAQRCGDTSVVTDLLDAVGAKNGVFSLELIPDVVPSIDELVISQHQKYRETALATLSTLLRNFGPIIHETTSSTLGSLGVDLSFEQRLEKCNSAKMSLQELVPKLEKLESRQGLHGRQAKDLRRRISDL
eukprot:evm.model.scf_775.5 EVM.evm.TU.scf_775.5   scf_775:43867-49059(+)